MAKKVERYNNIEAAATAKGISVRVLQIARNLNSPGIHPSGRVNWDLLGPWLQENNSKIEANANSLDDMDELRKRKLQAQTEMLELENQEMKSNLIDKEDLKQFLLSLSTAQAAILNSRLRDELPIKLVNKNQDEISSILVEVIKDLMRLFKEIKL
jgi:phage terminase Nu1 subunit (DNA packaging protein)